MCIWRQCNKDPSAALGMTVLGDRGKRGAFVLLAKAPERRFFFIGRCSKVVFKSRDTSHNNDTSSPLEKGRAKGAGWIHEAV